MDTVKYIYVSIFIITMIIIYNDTTPLGYNIYLYIRNPVIFIFYISIMFIILQYDILISLLLLFLLILVFTRYGATTAENFKTMADNEDSKNMVLNKLGISRKYITNMISDGINENNNKDIIQKTKEKYNTLSKKSGSTSEKIAKTQQTPEPAENAKITNKHVKKNSQGEDKDKITIRKRKFDIDSEQDTNLLATRDICYDIIDRINYEYETTEFLLKYITNQLEKIIDINDLAPD